MVGFELGGIEGEGDDAVLDLDVTTNRVDAMNVYGLAREVAVIYGRPLRPLRALLRARPGPPAVGAAPGGDRGAGPVPALRRPGPRRASRPLAGVDAEAAGADGGPAHQQHRRPEQLRHAGDGSSRPTPSTWPGSPPAACSVRWAREGEQLQTLDEVERTLRRRTGVVAGPEGALALAGIMGGASSEVSDETRTIALEAAYWDPLVIRRAAKALGMHTEASAPLRAGSRPERAAGGHRPRRAPSREARRGDHAARADRRACPSPSARRQVGFRAARAERGPRDRGAPRALLRRSSPASGFETRRRPAPASGRCRSRPGGETSLGKRT